MKNIANSNSRYFAALCALVLLLEAGCTASIAPSTKGTSVSLMAGLAPSSILSRYDMSNIVGLIEPREEAEQMITHIFPATGRANWSGTQRWGQAQFVDTNGYSFDVGAVVFNQQFPNIPLASGPVGSYAYVGDSLPIYTNGVTQNHVLVIPWDSTSGFYVNDSLTYNVVPNITNITFNQNLSRDSTITVNWTGTSSDFVLVSINTWDSTGMNDTVGHTLYEGGYFNNTGSVTLPVTQLILGLADVEVRVYTPKFLTLSNGKRVAVVVETGEEITVHIVN